MAMQFKVQFHRYSNGASRFSAPFFLYAEDFQGAEKAASLMRSAMAEVDLKSNYIVSSIETVGLRGEVAQTGWETAEEFSARLTPNNQ